MTDHEEYRNLLNQLAQRKGIEPEFRDNWGNLHSIPLETKKKILSAMGCGVEEFRGGEKSSPSR